MTVRTKARASARALLSGAFPGIAAGAVIGIALGGVYVAGLSGEAQVRAKAGRIAEAAGRDFSDLGLSSLAASNPAAMELALRYDPTLFSGADAGARQSAQFGAKLAGKGGLRDVNVRTPVQAVVAHPAAKPWNASPLDHARQLDCLTQAVYYEARGETPSGQAAVAQVVLNRVRHSAFPNSVCAVVYQGAQSGRCQFSFACNGAMRGRRENGAWKRAEKVAQRALDGFVMAEVGNATHFHVTSVNPRWNLVRVGQIGMHVFYRFGGRTGSPASFVAEPEREPTLPEAKPILASLTVVPAEPQSALASAAEAVVDAVVRADAAPAAAATIPPAAPPPVLKAPAPAQAKAPARPAKPDAPVEAPATASST